MLTRLRTLLLGDPAVPTVMHVTHAKAGSTWINALLRLLFRSRVAPRNREAARASGGDISKHVFAPGWIYPAMFLTREEFWAHEELRDIRRFVVIRDLRDTLISLYYSVKISHPLKQERVRQDRQVLLDLNDEDGLAYLLEKQLPGAATMQASWLNHQEIILRYEDLLENDFELLRDLLLKKFGLPASEAELRKAITATRFEATFGRKLGEEDLHSHGRTGKPGDWKNHFTPALRRKFGESFGDLLIATGYEKDHSWMQA